MVFAFGFGFGFGIDSAFGFGLGFVAGFVVGLDSSFGVGLDSNFALGSGLDSSALGSAGEWWRASCIELPNMLPLVPMRPPKCGASPVSPTVALIRG